MLRQHGKVDSEDKLILILEEEQAKNHHMRPIGVRKTQDLGSSETKRVMKINMV